MKLEMPAGKYVVAVSGGVDSVVLLDLLRLHPDAKLVVAHYDHGIREDSAEDRWHVARLAKQYKLPFVYDAGRLGAGASEAEAREARYIFLRKAQEASGADAIVTAHHQDDVLETAIMNLLRGTGRKGLSSLTSGKDLVRPLLDIPKLEIVDYAKRHGLVWREDSTNTNTDYLRNYVRLTVLPNWQTSDKQRLLDLAKRMRELNAEIDDALLANTQGDLNRDWFVLLPHSIAREVMASWLRQHGIRDFDRPTLERLTVGAKTAEPGKSIDIVKGNNIRIGKDHLALVPSER